MNIHQSINMKKSYSCAICKKSFLDPANLVKHVEFIHEPELSPIKSSSGSMAKKEKDPINNGPRVAVGAMAPPDFDRSVNPSSTKGGRLCPPNSTSTPGFSDLLTALEPVATPVLANQLTLSQPGGADYAHHITTGTPGFSDLPTALLIHE